LVDRIERTPNIEVWAQTQIAECREDNGGVLTTLVQQGSAPTALLAGGIYVMIGAEPRVEWTGLQLDASGFIVAPDLRTSMPNVFAVGDVRSDSVKRVASAAGEGAFVMRWINRIMRPELYR
jgi:thioredoxin reductase (NADPH)